MDSKQNVSVVRNAVMSALAISLLLLVSCGSNTSSVICIPDDYRIGGEWMLWASDMEKPRLAFHGCDGSEECEIPSNVSTGVIQLKDWRSWRYEDIQEDAFPKTETVESVVILADNIVAENLKSNTTDLIIWDTEERNDNTIGPGATVLLRCEPYVNGYIEEKYGKVRYCRRQVRVNSYVVEYNFRWDGKGAPDVTSLDEKIVNAVESWRCN